MRRSNRFLNWAVSAAVVVAAASTALAQDKGMMRHSFKGSDRWVKVFEDPKRDAWQKPEEVVKALDLQPGQAVADIGAGTGYFSRRLATAVGPTGVVYAVDIEPDMLQYIQKRAKEDGQSNIVTVLAAADNPMLPPNSTDLILIVDTIHHIEDRVGYFKILAEDLREGGQVAIVDFYKDKDIPVGPGKGMRLAKSQLIAEAEAGGFVVAQDFDFLPYQYFVVFRKK
jgi:ubiquinone/menaquinone biosynthesis C-methylase UbiE